MIAREASPAVSRLGLSVIGVIGVMVRPRAGSLCGHATCGCAHDVDEGGGRMGQSQRASAIVCGVGSSPHL